MEYKKIASVLGTTPDKVSRFITKKWVEVHDQLGNVEDRYKPSKQIRFKTSMLRSDLCDVSDADVKGAITVTGINNESRNNRPLAFKNNVPFNSCIRLIDNAEDLDVAMPMNNLIEYRKNYSKTTGSFWNYYRDELTDDTNDINFPNKSVINSKSFKHKTSITGSTYNADVRITNAEGNIVDNPAYDANKSGKKEVETVVPLKNLSNFWRTLDISLINA